MGICEASARVTDPSLQACTGWPVAVFAYNEEANIVNCLSSLPAAAGGFKLEVFVLANGCTDGTERVVTEYAQEHQHPNVNLISIDLGDKSNAWNVFVYDIAPDSDVYFFVDGDVQPNPNSLTALYCGLMDNSDAHAASALPAAGRSMEQWRNRILTNHGMPGNLYALRGTFVRRVREARIRLPTGLVGDDSILQALIKRNLDFRQEMVLDRIVPCSEAEFTFRSLSWFRLNDWRLYWRRRIRNSLRAYQNQMLVPVLKQHGVGAMPAHVIELYRATGNDCKLHWSGLNTIFDWIALRRITRLRETDC